VGPAYQKTHRSDSEPNRPSGWPTQLLKSFQKIPQATLSRTTSILGEQDKVIVDSDKQSDVYGNGSNQLDIGLLVVID
jgi:hypothetical protein